MLRIRHVEIEPALVLAPMEGVTDRTFRRLVRTIGGCGLTVTEFIPAGQLSLNVKRAMEMADFDQDERPISVQVYGRDPEVLGRAAQIVEELGADIVDLNMGCPSKKVCRNSGGSALMKDVSLATDIVRTIRASVDIPFTVKMRAGWDRSALNAPEIARMCEGEGADAVAVHWRTREEKYGGERDLSVVRAVKQAVSIPVLANGDIVDIASAFATLDETGCDGLMIGRGAIRNPWVFLQISQAMAGKPVTDADPAEKERVLLEYFADIRARFHTDKGALGRFKKISNYFARGLDGGGDLRMQILRSQTPDEAIAHIQQFFEAKRAAA